MNQELNYLIQELNRIAIEIQKHTRNKRVMNHLQDAITLLKKKEV